MNIMNLREALLTTAKIVPATVTEGSDEEFIAMGPFMVLDAEAHREKIQQRDEQCKLLIKWWEKTKELSCQEALLYEVLNLDITTPGGEVIHLPAHALVYIPANISHVWTVKEDGAYGRGDLRNLNEVQVYPEKMLLTTD